MCPEQASWSTQKGQGRRPGAETAACDRCVGSLSIAGDAVGGLHPQPAEPRILSLPKVLLGPRAGGCSGSTVCSDWRCRKSCPRVKPSGGCQCMGVGVVAGACGRRPWLVPVASTCVGVPPCGPAPAWRAAQTLAWDDEGDLVTFICSWRR